MYFTKKYWNTIVLIYKLNYINQSSLYNLNKESKSYLPLIFKSINLIIIYNGKKNLTYKLNLTNFLLKKLI
jgi:hypothetical protein